MATVLLVDYKNQNLNRVIENILEPMIILLKGFDKLIIRFWPVHGEPLEEQQVREHKFNLDINDWRKNLGLKFEVEISCDVGGLPQGPCHIWFKNIVTAFQDPKVQRVIYLPYDITFMEPKAVPGKPDRRLQSFIDRANKDDIDLLLGSYECSTDVGDADVNNFLIDKALAGKGKRKDIPKNFLEDLTILELERSFPNCMSWFHQQRNDPRLKPKPRTGFFSLSKRLYEQFINDRKIMKPWAGTVQLLICAAMRTHVGNKIFKIAEQFVAELSEPSTSWCDYRHAYQRLRIEFVIADEREFWSRKLPQVPL